MKYILLIALTTSFLFSCKDAPKGNSETVDPKSDCATNHLIGMVNTIEETTYTADSTGTIGAMDSCCIELQTMDEKGFVISSEDKNDKGDIVEVVNIARNEKGEFNSYTVTQDGKVTFTRTVIRDAEGNTKHAVDTDSAGLVINFFNETIFNELDQPIKGKMFAADSTYLGTWSRQYIDGLEVGRGWIDSSGIQILDFVGELNENGLLGKVIKTRQVGKDSKSVNIETYTYDSFDETGNWTQQTKSVDGKVAEVVKRVYTYFAKAD